MNCDWPLLELCPSDLHSEAIRRTQIQGGVKVLGHLGHLGKHVRFAHSWPNAQRLLHAIAELLVSFLLLVNAS